MAFEIAIDELRIGNAHVAYVTLPANKNTIVDAMDRAKVFGKTFLRIENCDEFPELNGYEFNEEPTLEELDFLAERLEEISEEITLKCAYHALLQKPMDTINEAINRTYNLDSVPVYPCANYSEYGEIVLDNGFLEELNDVPDEVYELLDTDKVGRAMANREGGVFINGYYVIADSYEPVLVYNDTLPKQPRDWVFKLEIAAEPDETEDISESETEILTLPADTDYMRQLAGRLGEKRIEDCVYVDFQSSIPQINSDFFDSMEDISTLNDIARKYSEMSRDEAAKFKAILECESCRGVGEIADIMRNQSCYEFDRRIEDLSDYGEKYLSKMLPEGFDKELLWGISSVGFTRDLLAVNGCKFTDYGVVSGFGGHLYSPIIAPEQEQKNDFEMGGIS